MTPTGAGGGASPGVGESALIDVGNVTLSNSTPWLESFVITNATLTFTNWGTVLHATNVFVQNDAVITHVGCDTNGAIHNTNRVAILCSNLTVLANGAIDVGSKGYAGVYDQAGQGPGGAPDLTGAYSAGAGYGSQGGSAGLGGGCTYGSVTAPVDLGSSSLVGQGSGTGGDGGGAVWIDADGAVTVGGTISANGGNGAYQFSGGGSGGSVYIHCRTFEGAGGIVRADGGLKGSSSQNGGGGGGRIAVHVDSPAQTNVSPMPSVRFSVAGREDRIAGRTWPGTLYLSDKILLPTSFSPETFSDMVLHGFSSWSPDALTVSNGWMAFGEAGFALDVTNSVTVCGSQGRLGFTNEPVSVTIGGDLSVVDGADLQVYSRATNGAMAYGTLVDVAGDVSIGVSSWIYPYSDPTNGGSAMFLARNLTVATNAGINADARGFSRVKSPSAGRGPGGALYVNAYSAGAGYGGKGGNSQNGTDGGPAYGSSMAPTSCGSSGASGSGVSGSGGGLVRVDVTGTVTLDGTISANGETGFSGGFGGGGSGGGIYVICHAFGGGPGAKVQARGGNGRHATSDGGGGGGRIAILRMEDGWQGVPIEQTNATAGGRGGTHVNAEDGYDGTVYMALDPDAPHVLNVAATNTSADAADLVGNLTATGNAPTEVYVCWGTNDAGGSFSAWQTNRSLGTASPALLTNAISSLTAGTRYYWRFFATNAAGYDWAMPSADFSTLGGLAVNNADGATSITLTSARLRGQVTVGNPDPNVIVHWGATQGDTNAASWSHHLDVGVQDAEFATNIYGLMANQTYWYRCYASNDNAQAWAPSATNFTTLTPSLTITDAQIAEGGGPTGMYFQVSLNATSAVDVSVNFVTSNGTAASGSDYDATNGTLVIEALATDKAVRVRVNGDGDDEYPLETLSLHLSDPTNVIIGDAVAVGTILDDDTFVETKTWSGTGDWTSDANWSSPGEPGPGDSVVIPAGSAVLGKASAALVSVVITNGATLTFTNWDAVLVATEVLVYSNATVTHVACDTNAAPSNSNRVNIACSNLTLAAGAAIDVDGRGFVGGVTVAGQGPGGAPRSSSYSGGGGYGSRGGDAFGGRAYGSITAPVEAGSAGSGGTSGTGANGGGAVRIAADGSVAIHGTVSANGGDALATWGGGGSGGGVYITCETFEGSGAILADGGHKGGSAQNGGGGGGRIAVHYDSGAQAALSPPPTVRFSVSGREDYFAGRTRPGSLYLTDSGFLPGAFGSNTINDAEIFGIASWAPSGVVVSNAWVVFGEPGFTLTVTNHLQVWGSSGRLGVTNSAGDISVGRDLLLTQGAELHVHSRATNVTPDHGTLVDVNGDIQIQPASWLYPHSHPVNGGSALFRAQNVTVATNAGFDADVAGYPGVKSPAAGVGPGGAALVNAYSAGGGYGGKGGDSQNGGDGGSTYGSSNAPVHPGSSGASGQGISGAGGGVIRLEAQRTVHVDGTLTANGGGGSSGFGGGGAGGSIYVSCRAFVGGTVGRLEAKGGNGAHATSDGGGGGRIAVWRTSDQWQGSPRHSC